MLKDMRNAKRIDRHAQSQKASIVHTTIISRHFWPSLESSDIVMPRLQSQYVKESSTFKPDKKLRWLPQCTASSNSRTAQSRRTSRHSRPHIWTVDELIGGAGAVDRTAALKALITWIDLGVLKVDKENTFRLLEVTEEASRPRAAPAAVEAPTVTATQTAAGRSNAVVLEVHRRDAHERAVASARLNPDDAAVCAGYDQTVEQLAGFMEA
ncbi:hypothetical protein DFH06DRAFT_1340882 [Mycena polygramma]|nr:hypothetical protein DFH06DRAFT_1340882 [Mycena polygramma]